MTKMRHNTPADLCVVQVDPAVEPAWVRRRFGDGALKMRPVDRRGLRLGIAETDGLSYVRAVLPDALELESREFERRVTEVYAAIREQLDELAARHPLRFWNFIPGIHRPAHDGMVRYEAFNAGRFAAFVDWYRTRNIGPRMVAASGIGHRCSDFVVQVLASERPGRGLENPRQRAAWRYSDRYGPFPPCFARATVVEEPDLPGRGTMIVAGTASVVGEDSRHDGDPRRQVEETCVNLASLVEAATQSCRVADPLARFRELRVYVVDETSRSAVVEALTAHLPGLRHLELMDADLCRADLLVEVEGVVSL